MCSIVGLEGNFSGELLIQMLKSSKNRGPDSSGIYFSPNFLKNNISLENFEINEKSNFAMGHNLLSVFKLNENDNAQPIAKDNLILVFNGEIYNFKSLCDFLNKTFYSDSYLLLNLIDFFYKQSNDLLDSVKKTLYKLDGDYSFAVYDSKNLAIARDLLGVKPLFYSLSDEFNAFASSKKSLKDIGLQDILSLKPGNILYDWKEIDFRKKPWKKEFDVDNSNLEGLLFDAVYKRVEFLDEIAVIFSGGVDSTILTLILKKIAEKKDLKIRLYAVGKKESKDVLAAQKVAHILGLPLKVQEVTEDIVLDNIETVVQAIGENNLMKIGVGMTVYLACKMIKEDGLRVAISGQGADELFAGYNRYLKSFLNNTLQEELIHDIEHMSEVNLERDDAVSMENSVELRLPFLDSKLVEFALNIPLKYKIKNSEDKIRKHILRDLAFNLGLNEEFAYRPKKAAQYGTGIDKILRKKVLKKVDIDSLLE